MEIRQLITFSTIVEQQSFSKTAEILGYTQAAVTIQIRQLEQEFHTRFFDRVGRRVELTPPGREFERYAREILKQDERAHRRLAGDVARGYSLRLGTLDSLLSVKIPPVVKHFYLHFPETQLKIIAGMPQELGEMLNRNELDMMYILDQPVSDSKWTKVVEAEEPIVFVASASSYLAKTPAIQLHELMNQPLFLTERGTNYRRALDQLLKENHLEARPFFETGNTDIIIQLIQANQGVSFLPRFAVEESVRNKKLAILNVENCSVSMYRQLFYHKQKWVTEEMKEVIRLASEPLPVK